MSGDRRKDVIRHLADQELDRLLAEADDPKVVRRLTFVKNLYEGDTLEEAANRVGKSESTGSRWARRWNEGGFGQLTPDFGDGRPPELGEDEQEELLELLRDGQPWKQQEIQHLLNEEFDVEYHPDYLSMFLRRPPSVIVALILILGFSLALTLTGFHTTYYGENKGFSPAVAATLFSLYSQIDTRNGSNFLVLGSRM